MSPEHRVVSAPPQGSRPLHLPVEIADWVAHADDNLILAQRLGEWISWAPDLEIDIALGNIGLDHLGVARNLYTYAGAVEGKGRTEDDFAMRRTERDFRNILLVEQPNGDFAQSVVRQFLFDVYQVDLWDRLTASDDDTIAGIAARAAKEAAYHLEFSSSWVVRLGDGTDDSHQRAQDAVHALWRFTGEISSASWEKQVSAVLTDATLAVPEDPYQRVGGRDGYHTEHLGYLLAEMQWMDRTYPGLEW